MARNTNFILTEEQEKELVDYCLKRVESLRADNKERIEEDERSWKAYLNDVEHRRQIDTIFDQSNLPLPVTSMAVDHFVSRAEDDVTGTSPFFHFQAQRGTSDRLTADEYDAFLRFKLDDQAQIRRKLEDAYLPIFIQRAHILKAVYRERHAEWVDREARVLHDRETGEAIEIIDYGFIIEEQAQWQEIPDPLTGELRLQLVGDETFFLDPERHEWKTPKHGIAFREKIYQGGDSQPVASDAFLCPMSASSIEEADFKCELYDKPLSWAKEMMLRRRWIGEKDLDGLYGDASAEAKTEGDRKKDDKEELSFDKKNPKLKVVECWVRRDVLGWGRPQEFVIFIEPEQKTAIFYEYQAKVCPDLKCPYTAIAIGRCKDRWWGIGIPEKIRHIQEYIDKQFNSASFRNELSANPIVGYNRGATEEEEEDPEIYAGKVVPLKDGKTISDAYSFAAIPNLDVKTQEYVEFVIELLQLWLGISNIAQGDLSDMKSHTTAMGVEASLKEASKLGRRWIRRIVRGFEEHLTKVVKLTLDTLDEEEAFKYMEGEVTKFGQIGPEDVREMEFDVTLVLSQERMNVDVESARLALEIQDQYFATPPELQPAKRPIFEKILNSLGYDDTDTLLPEMQQPMLGAADLGAAAPVMEEAMA